MTGSAPTYAWMNGKVIPWEQCVLHGRSAGAFMPDFDTASTPESASRAHER
jgi:hypothetical protein